MHTATIADWLFLLDDDSSAWKKNADETQFVPVVVPHDWAVEQDFDPNCSSGTGYLPGGVGWYRAHLSISEHGLAEAGRVRLIFHGAYKNADVWVNGYHFGRRPSGFAEFWFDLTEIVGYAPDDDLVIAVRIERHDLADSRWYNGTGLTRRVDIEAHPAVTLAHNGTVVTTVEADENSATLEIVQTVENHTAEPVTASISHRLGLAQPEGGSSDDLGSEQLEIEAGGSVELRRTVTVSNPQLWSDDSPSLYRLVSQVEAGEHRSEHTQTVGIRTFEFHPDKGFFINGQHRVLKGVCVHDDAGVLGVAVPAEVWLRRLLVLKEAGCNAIRMAHNSHSPELYHLCDLIGLYVIDEAFDEWESPKNKWWQGHNVYPPKHQGYAHDYHPWHVADLTSLIEAHRKHPSVIAWSVGNEIDYPNDPYASPLFEQMTGNNDANKPAAERVYDPNRPDVRRLTTLAGELIDIVKAIDTTRPVTLAAAFPELSSQTGLLDRLDLIGYNYKEHLYPEHHALFPNQPLLGSENGHSYANWRAVTDQEFIGGQFLWTGIDFFGETVGWPSHGSGAGIITTAGFAKERYHQRRSWWADEPVLRVATRPVTDEVDVPEWKRPFGRDWAAGSTVEVAVFSNLDDVQVSAGDQAVELSFDDELGCLIGTVTVTDEPLIATGGRDGQTLRDEIHRAGEPASLQVENWAVPEQWQAGVDEINRGRALVRQVIVQVLDADGRPAAGEVEIEATVEGGDLLGLDSGDLTDTSPCTATVRRTHEGTLVAYLRGADAVLTLRAAELPDVVVDGS